MIKRFYGTPRSSHSRQTAAIMPGVATVCMMFASGCENAPPQDLKTPSPDAQVSKIAPASPEQKKDAPLPDEFRRFEYDAEGRDELTIGLHVEEVISGVRLQTELDDAEPGTYLAVFHENGTCEGLDTVKLGPSVDLMSAGTGMKGADGAAIYPLGQVEVNADGDGDARWLTAMGNLRESQKNSLLGGVFALYRSESAKVVGKLMACVVVSDKKTD